MASHKSAKKRIRSNAKKREVNKQIESKIKTLVKRALSAEEKEEGEKSYKKAVAYLDKTSSKGKLHKNTAARKKAALTKNLNQLQTSK